MKNSIFSLALASLLFSGMLPVWAQQTPATAVSVPSAAAWQSPDDLSQKLAETLIGRLPEPDAKALHSFVKKEENLQLLRICHFARIEKGHAQWNNN